MRDFNIKNFLFDIFTYICACAIVGIGILLAVYYLKEPVTLVSFIGGMIGFILLYPAFKTWQDRIKGLF